VIREIRAKVLLSHVRFPDSWFGIRYNMNLYRGCEHQCIYCDSRSECYGIEDFRDVLVKANAIELLEQELPRKRVKGTIGTGAMSDPYRPSEATLNMTGQALEVIARHGFGVHITTKSDLILKDLDALCRVNQAHASVFFTVTTTDDALGKKVEPEAPPVSQRLRAMRILADHGIVTGVAMMPILPFIEDTEENVLDIVEQAHRNGARYIVPWFGMSMRDRQRAYYYDKLDALFPGLRPLYERRFGDRYMCSANNSERLAEVFYARCREYGIADRTPAYDPTSHVKQLSMF